MSSPLFLRNFVRIYWMALLIMLVCGLLQLGSIPEYLKYDRHLVWNGEPWRFLTANFVHLTWSHYGMNMGALGLMWLMFVSRLNSLEWVLVILLASLVVSTGVQLLNPNLIWFVGLSGTLHGIILAGVWREFPKDRVFACSVGALTIAKLTYEQIYGAMPGSEDTAGGPVIVDAHLYGAIGGVITIMAIDLGKLLWRVLAKSTPRGNK